ncbi:MAG TPA: TetR/AcrR family transcriptional regulator [Actinomycetota bacterium]|jgi:TetR/AcrR family transcriptional regulator, cholesterol catabolism regulator|nr:TetR/AcrR family transcriptional regulator [Actinomycetota bacterium]
MSRVVERSSPRRAEVVRAAARLFSERGYHGTSMQHLGDALGLLRGSLYAHIGSKEELLFEVVDEGAERFLARGAEAVALKASAAERLEALLVGHVETAAVHLEAATVFLNEWRYLSDDLRAIIQAKRDRYEAMVTEIVEDGIASGEFRADADARLAVLLVLSAANWTYEWYRPGGRLTPREVGGRFAGLIVNGLRSTGKGDVG